MNSFQKFIAEHPGGFLRDTDMPALIALHRLCPCIVRCGGCRFVAGAQDVPHLIKCIQAGGHYVRDVSITSDAQQNAAAWHYEPTADEVRAHFAKPAPCSPTLPEHAKPRLMAAVAKLRAQHQHNTAFDESQCGGAFDGFSVSSDADSGL